MSIWKQGYVLKNKDVNLYRKLRTQRLMEMLQEGCVDHTSALGAGREKTMDRGILWVVIQQYVKVHRMPEYDEEITVETWPGNTMHVLFPRYFRVVEKHTSELLIEASALWTLIDAKTRKMVFADRYGVDVPGETTGKEIALPKAIRKEETDQHRSFTVPYSYCDLNGHMNNTRYFDLAEDCIPAAAEGKELSSITTEYASEARYNETIQVSWKQNHNSWYISGEADKMCFRMQFEYKD